MATVVPVDASSAMMKAAYVTEWLGVGTVPDKISFGNIPVPPAPQKAEVLIAVKAASINVDDVPLLQDTAAGGWFYHTRKPSAAKPVVGGSDYAGVVLACGPDCQKLKVGDRVCGLIKPMEHQAGTWAEQTLAPESDVCLISDDGMSFVDAAAVAMGAFVNFNLIKNATEKLSGRCLVLGASGALGTVLLQMLRKHNGHITAVCSGKNAESVRKMGANEVIDYTIKPFGEQLIAAEQFSVVFDFVGGKEMQRDAEKLLMRNGIYVTAVGPRQNVMDERLSCCSWLGSLCHILCGCTRSYKYVMSGAYPPLTAAIWKASVLDCNARAAIAEELPFEEQPFRKALRRVASHHPGGRVIINLEPI